LPKVGFYNNEENEMIKNGTNREYAAKVAQTEVPEDSNTPFS